MSQWASFGAVLVVVVLAFGGVEYYIYQTLSAGQDVNRAALSLQSAEVSSLQGNLAELHGNVSSLLSTISSLQASMVSLNSQLALAKQNQTIDSQQILTLQQQLQNLTSQYNAFVANLVVGLMSYEVQYYGNGMPGHNVGVPFDPKLVVIEDLNTEMRATVFHGINNTWDTIYLGLTLYQSDTYYGPTVFWFNGQYDISLVGSAPDGTLNNVGDQYQAFFYG